MENCDFLNRLQEKYEIILASKSERRKQLLAELGLKFKVCNAIDVDESFPKNQSHSEIVQHIALNKATAYQNILTEKQLLIASDTIVVLENQILGKPKNRAEAVDYLKQLSDNLHTVYTGVCIMTTDKIKVFHAQTNVWFGHLTHDEIEFYVQKYKPFDKAGAYGIQEWIGMIGICRIEGSYYNVVGMPIQLIYNELRNFI
ncbi:MAG: Maf family nucleotide pyrophosphatase [Salinivirgaceae bacterium]|nr:Maf family nucleotide pyrophosphatase [Salinivirgaceae bacterium]MDD4747200.1 Maf family nucleotide pyrophosphatase [Salinivirgaceae bacterium]MDY0279436.1 Maf family nucleotide pyrophosphatase [Salinivirgaceae bacterium]